MSKEEIDPLIGRNLGDFIIEEKLGEGGFGAVYQANQITLSRPAVVKVLHTKHRKSEDIIKRFKREAYLASRLEHPYMAHIYSFGAEPGGLLWIAMEMVAGTPLDQWLKSNGAMPLARFVPLFDKICEAIHTAHEAGIIHRDIKPANIMVISRAGRLLPKLLDFGIAKDLSLQHSSLTENETSPSISSTNLDGLSTATTEARTLRIEPTAKPTTSQVSEDTNISTIIQSNAKKDPSSNGQSNSQNNSQNSGISSLIKNLVFAEQNFSQNSLSAISAIDTEEKALLQTQGIMGSPKYMAPEQWENAVKADARSDIYALGVTAYELLTGEVPFKTTGTSLMISHLTETVPNLKDSFPTKLNEVIAKAMAKSPKDRYKTALEFAQDLREAAGFSDQQANLPQLDSLLTSQILNDAPQPIADSVANLNAAKNAFQLRDNILVAFRVLVRYLGLLALASHSSIKLAQKEPENILANVKKLCTSGLNEFEWVNFIKDLCASFSNQKDLHPIPELVSLFFNQEGSKENKFTESLKALLDLERTRNVLTKEEQLIKDLTLAINHLAAILQAVSFLGSYLLVVPNGESAVTNQVGEKWMGAVKVNHPLIKLKGKSFKENEPVLTDFEGNVVLSLWPLIQVASPSPGQAKELFLLERKGRHGAKLVSFPAGFEHEDENPWQWLKDLFFTNEENLGNLSEEKSPYLGLSTFKSEDVSFFYGREKETESFLNRLKIQPFLAIVGPSGAGKSSFVQAGIIPSLEKGWRTITVRPGVSPLTNLAARLIKEGIEIAKSPTELKTNPEILGNALRNIAYETNTSILLIIDQFEELFTLCLDQQEREIYAEHLAKAARSEEEPIRIIITLRDDFLIRVKSLPGLQDKITQNLELLTTPQPTDLLRILTEPAKRLGYQFEDTELPREIVESVKKESSALPLLAFTAAKLWELRDRQFKQLRRKTYEAMGGIGGSLTQHAENVMAEMSQDEQKLVKEAFRHLVTSEGTRFVVTRSDLRQLLGNNREADLVIEKLVTARLLVASEGEAGSETIEVIHEALLSAWPRLVRWRQEASEGARLRDQLRAAARQWQERNRPNGLLWRDEALTEYQLWRERYTGNLTEIEEEFATASISEATRNQRLRRKLLITAITVLIVGLAIVLYQQQKTKKQLLETLELYEEQGRQEMFKNNLDGAAVYLSEAYSKGRDSLALRYMLSVALAKLENHPPIILSNHTDALTMAIFSPDDQLVATASKDKTARIWQARDGKELFTLKGHEDTVTSCQFSPDSKLLLTTSLDKTACIWKTSDGSLIAKLSGHSDGIKNALFSPNGKQIVTISYDKTAKIWDSATGQLNNTLSGHLGTIYSVCYSEDGKKILTSSADKTAKIWDSTTGKLENTLVGHSATVTNITLSPDNKLIVTSSNDKTARIWQLIDGQLVRVVSLPEGAITDCKFSPDGKSILTTNSNSKAYIWDTKTGKLSTTLEGHEANIINGEFSHDGKLVITSSYDKSLRIWESATGKFLVALEHLAPLSSGCFAHKEEKILTASGDKTAKIWQVVAENRLPSQIALTVEEKDLFYLNEGRLIAKAQAPQPSSDPTPMTKTEISSSDKLYIEDLGNDVKIEMIKLEGGIFEMGAAPTEPNYNKDERQHTVKVSPFYIGKYEITQAQWKAVAALPPVNIQLKVDPAKFKGDSLPVENISWEEAVEFCTRLSKATGKHYRLPTESEWEYAARAGTRTEYPENLDDVAWYEKNAEGKTHTVGQKKPNAWGLYDAFGNVNEWCVDWYTDYPTEFAIDPIGTSGKYRIYRGGNWYGPIVNCRAAFRFGDLPDGRSSVVGFRLIMKD